MDKDQYNILITGANSFIGKSVREYLQQWKEKYTVAEKDAKGWDPKPEDFDDYDVVLNVIGMAHVKETVRNRKQYYDVNRDLVVKIAQTAKEGGVRHFIHLSTMAVYGLSERCIKKSSPELPINAYGKSKAEADEAIRKLADDSFKFACLRPPMVYGKGCKGNYRLVRRAALMLPVFPDYNNQRSMIYIGNLCVFIKSCIDERKEGIFFPQNADYVCTSDLMECIAVVHGRKIRETRKFNGIIGSIPLTMIKKAFGDLVYEKTDLVNEFGFEESIRLTEGLGNE